MNNIKTVEVGRVPQCYARENDHESFRHRKNNRYGVRYDLLKTQITQYILLLIAALIDFHRSGTC